MTIYDGGCASGSRGIAPCADAKQARDAGTGFWSHRRSGCHQLGDVFLDGGDLRRPTVIRLYTGCEFVVVNKQFSAVPVQLDLAGPRPTAVRLTAEPESDFSLSHVDQTSAHVSPIV
ncbi:MULTISPECIES: hypothetical protein [unclassified Rhodococcus (in: high G+C Gram-positive bacteria)]|uniref:hypothetical protein n=1 Tax=unclassified Rhodococcus (in: high G+C Gram-positive bacteria) TaxID=192944 RepID=UPI0011402CF1|nr:MULTISPECIES: hypothetical protein [unclassified Rhodococcus (in: high G+C Gram-positive bacteria)]